MALFLTAIRRDPVSLFRLPFLCHVQIFSWLLLLFSFLKRNNWNHIFGWKKFVLNRNTWNYINLRKILVFNWKICKHIAVCKLLVFDRNIWNFILNIGEYMNISKNCSFRGKSTFVKMKVCHKLFFFNAWSITIWNLLVLDKNRWKYKTVC